MLERARVEMVFPFLKDCNEKVTGACYNPKFEEVIAAALEKVRLHMVVPSNVLG